MGIIIILCYVPVFVILWYVLKYALKKTLKERFKMAYLIIVFSLLIPLVFIGLSFLMLELAFATGAEL